MYAKLKVRARLILVDKRLPVFIYSLLFFILRFFLLALMLACGAGMFFALSQKSDYNNIGKGHFFLICLSLVLIFLIALYFYALAYLKRCKYFEGIILEEKVKQKKDESFTDEIKTTFRVLATSFFISLIKFAWLLFFSAPAILLFAFILFRLSLGGIAENVLKILISSLVCLLLFGLLFYFCMVQRYVLALRVTGLKKIGIFKAIKESTKSIDGWSAGIAIFKIGLALWYGLCFLLVPAFYIVPYSRLSFELLCQKYISENIKEDLDIYSTKKLPKI